MRLSDETYEYIKREIVHLFETVGIQCTPISGFEIAYKLGIKLIPYSAVSNKYHPQLLEASKDGFFLETIRQEYIFYNDEVANENFARANRTILHEIAHDVLGHTGLPNNQKVEEAEADFFGKYAAATPPLVHRFHPHSPFDLIAPFNLSEQAALYNYNYYRKWLNYGADDYLDYEVALLSLFNKSA